MGIRYGLLRGVVANLGCWVTRTKSACSYCGEYFGYYCFYFDVSCEMAKVFSGEGCEETEETCQGVP
jgi:hypothetical protein